jgi:hypothetical protein
LFDDFVDLGLGILGFERGEIASAFKEIFLKISGIRDHLARDVGLDPFRDLGKPFIFLPFIIIST